MLDLPGEDENELNKDTPTRKSEKESTQYT